MDGSRHAPHHKPVMQDLQLRISRHCMLGIPERLVCAQLECVMPTWCHVGVLCKATGRLCHAVLAAPKWPKEPVLMEDIAWMAAGMLQVAPRARCRHTTNP